jgi:hypothetical protein
VSRHKHLIFLVALTAVLSVGWSTESQAQVFRPGPRVVIAGGFYTSPYFLYGYDPLYAEGQWAYPYRYPYRPYGDLGASVRLEVKPKQAEVYVDGYYAGIVDDFNGTFQRLHVAPGEHEIELYYDGYRTTRQHVYLTPDNTFKLKYTMERLAAGEQPEPRPQPSEPPQMGAPGQMPAPLPGQGGPPQMYPPPPPRGPMGRRAPQPQQPPQQMPNEPRGGQVGAYGTIALRVQPGDADVLVDGEKWQGPAGQDRLVIDVAEGRHTIEIQKAGYRGYVTEIDVRRGETTPVNVSLRSQDQ